MTVVVESLINWIEGKTNHEENFDTNISINEQNNEKIIENEKINGQNGQNSIKIKKSEKKKNSNGEIEEEENFEIKNVNVVVNGNAIHSNGSENKGNVRVTRSRATHCYKE